MLRSKFLNRIEIRLLILSLLLAFIVLYGFNEGSKPLPTSGDGPLYNLLATNLIDFGVYSNSTAAPVQPTIYRTPGYPLFLALVYYLFGLSMFPVLLIQFMLNGLATLLLYRLGLLVTDESAARIAAVLCLIHFPFIFIATYITSEVLVTTITVLIVLQIVILRKTNYRNSLVILVGATLGAAAMVRPSFLLLPIFVSVGLLIDKGFPRFRNGRVLFHVVLSLVVGFSLIIGPWVFRNYSVSGELLVSTGSAESFFWSVRQHKGMTNYNLSGGDWEQQYFPKTVEVAAAAEKAAKLAAATGTEPLPTSVITDLKIEEEWQRRATSELNDLSLLQGAIWLPKRVSALWAPSYVYAPHWIYYRGIQLIPGIMGWLLLVMAAAGLLTRRRTFWQDWPIWIVPAYLTVVHTVFHLESRYSIPGQPFILVYAAVAIVWTWKRASDDRRVLIFNK